MANTNSTNKVTKLEVVTMMLADSNISANATFKAYLENEKSLLEKKRDNKKATKTQTENEDIKALILEVLAEGSGTITDIQSRNAELKAMSNQKVSALVRQLKESGSVDKSVVKGKSIFSLVAEG